MTQDKKPDELLVRLNTLKQETERRREERLRCEAELNTLEKTKKELEKKVREELGVEPEQLDEHVKKLEAEVIKLLDEAEVLITQSEEKTGERTASE